MLERAKVNNLIQTRELDEDKTNNTKLNQQEISNRDTALKSYPQRLVFELTNACNLNCLMCGRNAAEFKPTRFDINWTRKFDSAAKYIEEVTLMGWGEPTMHPQFTEFLKWANKHGMRKYFCTNGMKLGELCDTIFEQKVDVIAISMDAANDALNQSIRRGADFNRILGGIKKIVARKTELDSPFPYMNFVITLMRKNIYELPKLIRLAADIGLEEVKGVYLTAFNKDFLPETLFTEVALLEQVFGEAEELAERLNIKLKLPHIPGQDPSGEKEHKDCNMVWRDLFLGSDGFIRPCMSNSVKLFDFNKYDTFEEMWNSEEMMQVRKDVNDSERMHDNCRYCFQSSFANWNKETAFNQLGKVFSPTWE